MGKKNMSIANNSYFNTLAVRFVTINVFSNKYVPVA